MDVAEELRQAFQNMRSGDRMTMVIPAQVTALHEADATVDVVDVDGNEIFEVRLRAAVDELQDGVTVFPSVDSWVLIANLGGSASEWAVISTTEVEKVLIKTDACSLEIAADGVAINRGFENLKSVLNDMLAAIKLITVTCAAPGSPSTTPLNFAAFDLLETRINNLLK